jgi:hypothetical protein
MPALRTVMARLATLDDAMVGVRFTHWLQVNTIHIDDNPLWPALASVG